MPEPILKVDAVVIGKSTSPHPGQPIIVTIDVPALKQQMTLNITEDSGIDPAKFGELVFTQTNPRTGEQDVIYANADQRQKLYLVLYDKDEYDMAQAALPNKGAAIGGIGGAPQTQATPPSAPATTTTPPTTSTAPADPKVQ